MAQKREIPQSVLEQAFKQTQEQKAKTGFSPTTDANFPVMKPYLNQQVVVYIPKTNTITDEEGKEIMQFTNSVRHRVKRGGFTEYMRCINDLEIPELGWDGECPLCKATEESWDLYNHRLEQEAARLGLSSPKDDPNKTLDAFKKKIGEDRMVDGREAYRSFPVVVIPTGADKLPNGEEPQVFIMDMRAGRFMDLIDKSLQNLLVKPEYPHGLFFIFNYIYDTKGQQPNPRDAGKALTVSVIESATHLESLNPLIPTLEEKAKEFTIQKINSVLVANEIKYKDEIEEYANKVMQSTRMQLKAIEKGEQAMLQGGGVAGAPQLAPPPNSTLMNYGQPVPQGQQQQVDPNFNPIMQGNPLPQGGAPVQQGNPVPQGAPVGQPPQQMQGNQVPQGQPLPQQPPVQQGAPVQPNPSPLGQGVAPNVNPAQQQ